MKSFLLLTLLTLTLTSSVTYDTSKAVKDTSYKYFNTYLCAHDLLDNMGMGWNLGNSLDCAGDGFNNEGLSSETSWGNTKTTQALINTVANKGFKTIRIPVSWHNHIVDYQYTIDPNWTTRVKEVVDWAIAKGLYVILNVHHDVAANSYVSYGQGYYPNKASQTESTKFLLNVWTQIALAFNNGYDEHLIFEALNEPRLRGNTYEWWYNAGNSDCEEANEVLNAYNKLILGVIRTSGGNNLKRFIMFTSQAASFGSITGSNFVIPDDTVYNSDTSLRRILISVHMYSPYNFAMDAYSGVTTCDSSCQSELDTYFNTLYNTFVLKGYRVVVGEMGAINKNNLSARVAWAKYFVTQARSKGLASVVWDNQYWGTGSQGETFGLLHRDALYWEPEELVNALISAAKTTLAW